MFLYPFFDVSYTPAGGVGPVNHENAAVRLSDIQYYCSGLIYTDRTADEKDIIPTIVLHLRGSSEPVVWVFNDYDDQFYAVWAHLTETLEVTFVE